MRGSERWARILITLLGKSWRIRRVTPPTGMNSNRVLYSFWHGSQLALLFTHRYRGITVMVSRSDDGGLIAGILHSLGFHTVRGSSSRDGARAAVAMCRALKKGCGAITPDGPRGPARVPKPGLFAIPARAGAPLAPMGVGAWPAVRLGSWDRFLIPLPFCRLAVAEGIPIRPGKITRAGVMAEMGRVTALAELAVSPLASLQAAASAGLAGLALPALLFRPRRERRERLGYPAVTGSRPAWLHGSSLGELRGLLPVAAKLTSRGVPVFITCFTPSGREFIEREGFEGGFLPVDTPGPVQKFLNRVKPRCLILAETELWPCLLRETVLRGVPAGMVNARLSPGSVSRYRPIRRLLAGCLSCFAGILVRTEKDARAFAALGVREGLVTVAGDGKSLVPPGTPDPDWKDRLVPGMSYLVAGSTRKGEEEFVLRAAETAGIGVILAPRHSSRVEGVVALARRMGLEPALFSSGARSGCLILDGQGVLPRIYPLGEAAFLGGTVAPVGGHNILEPLSHGIPVIVGPHHGNHAELVNRGLEVGVTAIARNPEEMASILKGWRGGEDRSSAARKLAASDSPDEKLEELLNRMNL